MLPMPEHGPCCSIGMCSQLVLQIEKLEQMLPMSEDGGASAAAEGGSEKDEAAMAARAQEQQLVRCLHCITALWLDWFWVARLVGVRKPRQRCRQGCAGTAVGELAPLPAHRLGWWQAGSSHTCPSAQLPSWCHRVRSTPLHPTAMPAAAH